MLYKACRMSIICAHITCNYLLVFFKVAVSKSSGCCCGLLVDVAWLVGGESSTGVGGCVFPPKCEPHTHPPTPTDTHQRHLPAWIPSHLPHHSKYRSIRNIFLFI